MRSNIPKISASNGKISQRRLTQRLNVFDTDHSSLLRCSCWLWLLRSHHFIEACTKDAGTGANIENLAIGSC